jgi:TPR repeat protein
MFLKSAEQGYALAQRLHGLMSVHVNPSVGERWMLRAAEQGDAEAQFWLGVAYEQNEVAFYGEKQLSLRDPDGYSLCFQSPATRE